MVEKSFTYVYVPWDIDEPIQERRMVIPEGKDVECLLDELKLHFAQTEKNKAQAEAHKKALMEKLPKEAKDTKNLDHVLKAAVGLQMVENIGLLANSPTTGYVGVNMYVDDEGALKDLPLNRRASGIAQCCGRMLEGRPSRYKLLKRLHLSWIFHLSSSAWQGGRCCLVRGDAFLARVFDNEDEFQRMDFALDELNSSADWVKQAHQQSVGRMQREEAEAQLKQLQRRAAMATPAPAARAPPPAEVAKAEGNAAFKRQDYEAAVQHYGQALDLDAHMLSARNNRAMALLKCERFAEAEADCNAVLVAEPSNVKALLRRGAARRGQNRLEEASADFEKVLQLQPANADARSALQELANSSE